MTLNSTIFSVLCVNTRSVLAHNNTTKLDEIELLAAEYNFTVVYLTETWLDNVVRYRSITLLFNLMTMLIFFVWIDIDMAVAS